MEDSAVLALVGTGVESVVVFVEFGKVDLDRRVEVDFEQIVAILENTLYVDAPCAVHIVGAEYAVVVEIYVGIGVETVENELLIGLSYFIGGGAEIGLVHPVLLVDPLHGALVEPIERILDEIVGHQVGMNCSGHCGRIPVLAASLAKTPAVVEGA